MPLAQLITAEQLARRLDDSALRILDCRFALEDSTYGERSYRQGHVPGARFADLEKDLSGPVTPGVTGRHPLPDPERLAARFRQWGLDDDSDVVLYDDGPGAFAARAWWLLLWLGKRDGIYLLDGGLKAWREAGLPMDEAIPDTEPGTFSGRADSSLIIDASTLQERLDDPQLALLDARALPRFRRSRTHRSDRRAYPQCHLRSVHRESPRRRPVSPGRTAAQALRTAAGQQATPAHRRLLWLRRDRLPQPVCPVSGWLSAGDALSRLLERVDHRHPAASRLSPTTTRRQQARRG